MGPCGSKKTKREPLKPKQEVLFKQQQLPTKPVMVKSEVKEEIENVPPEQYQKLSKTQKPQQIILPSLLIQQDQAPHNHMQSILKGVNPQNNLEISMPIRYEQGYKVEIRGKQP
ncbi:hypothetical protein pb186bvf_015045 [Paramecium bursaria]